MYLNKRVFVMLRAFADSEGRPRSDRADAQSDQGHRCLLPESLDTKACISCEQTPG